MTDLHCSCGFCGDLICRTEAAVGMSLVGVASCLDCADALTGEEVEPAYDGPGEEDLLRHKLREGHRDEIRNNVRRFGVA